MHVIVLGLLSVVTALGQGPKPKLPPPLNADELVMEAFQVGIEHEDEARRRAAVQTICEALPQAEPQAQAQFLIRWEGASPALLEEVDVRPYWQRLGRAYPALADEIYGALVQTGSGDRARTMRMGALACSRYLERPSGKLVRAVADYLDKPTFADRARRSLLVITGWEFRTQEDFQAWWNQYGDQTQVDWLRAAQLRDRQLLVEQWRKRLEREPALSLEAIQVPIWEIRQLGQSYLRDLPPLPKEPEAAKQERERRRNAFRNSWNQETRPSLRLGMVPLIPRFLPGKEGVEWLREAMKGELDLRLAAVRALRAVRPQKLGRQEVLRLVSACYAVVPLDVVQYPPKLRANLLSSMVATVPPGTALGEEEQVELRELLLHAFLIEREETVRDEVYAAIGNLGDPYFFEVVKPMNQWADRSLAERLTAMDAFALIRTDDAGQLQDRLDVFHELLQDSALEIRRRAIQKLRRLGNPESAVFLAQSLRDVEEASLKTELVAALGDMPNNAGLQPLLDYVPPKDPGAREAYQQAINNQLIVHKSNGNGNGMGEHKDPEKLKLALQALIRNEVWQVAFALADEYPREGLNDEQQTQFEQDYTLSLAHWLLEANLESDRAVRAEEAVGRLRDLMDKNPETIQWPYLLARLEVARKQPAAALDAAKLYVQLCRQQEVDCGNFVLQMVQVARDPELAQAGLDLIEAVGPTAGDQDSRIGELRKELQDLLPSSDETPMETADSTSVETGTTSGAEEGGSGVSVEKEPPRVEPREAEGGRPNLL